MKKPSLISLIFMSLILLVGLGVGVFTISQKSGGQFDVRKRASGGLGVATLTLQTSATMRYVGDIFKLDIMINTAGKKISGAAFRLVLPYSAAPVLELLDDDPNADGTQITSHATSLGSGMATSVNTAQSQPSGQMFIDLAAITSDPNGFTSDVNGQKFATMRLKAKKTGSVTFEHNSEASRITDKETGLDILRTIAPYTITVVADTEKPTVTITDGPAEGSTSTSSAVTFRWSGTDVPVRPADTAIDLKYQYQFDTTASTYVSDSSVTKTLTHGTHAFKVRAKDVSNNEGSFTAVRTFKLNLTPQINSVTPDGGNVGTVVTIKGYNFGTTKATVKFGGVAATAADITSWTDTQIVVKVPAAAKDNVTVTSAAALTSNTAAFNVGTAITLVVKLQGITGQSANKTATLVVRRGTTETQRFENKVLSWSPTDSAYSVTVVFSSDIPTASDYTVSIKEGSRLRKKFTGISLTTAVDNKRVKTAAADLLQVGDFNNDNKLTISDFGVLMTNFNQTTGLTVPVTSANAKFDLNGDGNLSILDIGLLLANYTALEKPGDNE